jgi:hypothetical protein
VPFSGLITGPDDDGKNPLAPIFLEGATSPNQRQTSADVVALGSFFAEIANAQPFAKLANP